MENGYSDKGKKAQEVVDCSVLNLEGAKTNIEINKNSPGSFLVNKVIDQLGIIEKEYFGIYFLDIDGRKKWLNLNKSVYRQFKGVLPQFYFGIRFYEPDPEKLKDDLTRYLLYLQLRDDIVSGTLKTELEVYSVLGAYTTQTEVGDYDPITHGPNYLEGYQFAPKQDARLLLSIKDKHRRCSGQTPATAELKFLKIASRLPAYGAQCFAARMDKEDFQAGICPFGVMLVKENSIVTKILWARMEQIVRKQATIRIVYVNEEKEVATLSFKLCSQSEAKRFYNDCTNTHTFYRLARPDSAPRNKVLQLKRSTKSRYSDRTLTQLRSSEAPSSKGKSLPFIRQPSRQPIAFGTLGNVGTIGTLANIGTMSQSAYLNGTLGNPSRVAQQHLSVSTTSRLHTPSQSGHPAVLLKSPRAMATLQARSTAASHSDTVSLRSVNLSRNPAQEEIWDEVEETAADGTKRIVRRRRIITTTTTTTYLLNADGSTQVKKEVAEEYKPVPLIVPPRPQGASTPTIDTDSVEHEVEHRFVSGRSNTVEASLTPETQSETNSAKDAVTPEVETSVADLESVGEVEKILMSQLRNNTTVPRPAVVPKKQPALTSLLTHKRHSLKQSTTELEAKVALALSVDTVQTGESDSPTSVYNQGTSSSLRRSIGRSNGKEPSSSEYRPDPSSSGHAETQGGPTSATLPDVNDSSVELPRGNDAVSPGIDLDGLSPPPADLLDESNLPSPDRSVNTELSWRRLGALEIDTTSHTSTPRGVGIQLVTKEDLIRNYQHGGMHQDVYSKPREDVTPEVKYSLRDDLNLNHEQGERGFVKGLIKRNEVIIKDVAKPADESRRRLSSSEWARHPSASESFDESGHRYDRHIVITRTESFKVGNESVVKTTEPPTFESTPALAIPTDASGVTFVVNRPVS